MVAPSFGFSIGDFIAGTKLLASILSAFKSAGGASSKYSSEVAFLLSLASTIQQLEDHLESHQNDDTSKGIVKLLQLIEKPLAEFKIFLDKYTEALDAAGKDHDSRFRKAQKTISYTLKDLSGKVEKLRREIEQPLNAINTLLSLQVIKTIEKLPDEPLRPEQCAQIVNAIIEADISTELDKQIKVLQQSANDHSLEHDEHSERIQELKRELDEGLASLQSNLGDLADAIADKLANREDQQGASDEVQTSLSLLNAAFEGNTKKIDAHIREQETFLLAMEAFLEDKGAMQVTAMVPEPSMQGQITPSSQDQSWPAATLPTAHLAISLLSLVVSGVVAVTVTRLKRETASVTTNSFGPTAIPAACLPVFARVPSVLDSIGALSKERDSRASEWKDEFAISSTPSVADAQAAMPLPAIKKPIIPVLIPSYSTIEPAGWSNKLSKLNEDDRDHDHDKSEHNDTDDLSQPRDIDYLNTPGMVLQSPADKDSGHVPEEDNAALAPIADETDTSTSPPSVYIAPTPVEPAPVESTHTPFTPTPSTPITSTPISNNYSHNHNYQSSSAASSSSSSSGGYGGGYSYSSSDDSDSD